MLEVFDNDRKYLDYLTMHPTHLVLNAHKRPKATYLMLHRASCLNINQIRGRGGKGGFTERTFLKVVSDQELELKDWIRAQKLPGEFSSVCKMCFK